MGLIDSLFANTRLRGYISHRILYLLGIATILCGLAWSTVLMSIGQFIILGNAILELDFSSKWQRLKKNKVFWAIASLYLFHILGLIWSSDLEYGFKDLRIKVPLLLLPLIIASSKPLLDKEWRIIFRIYILTLLCLSLYSFYQLWTSWDNLNLDKRSLSVNISHIRYGLNIALAAMALLIFRIETNYKKLSMLVGLWFLVCLLLFELYTGIICLSISLILFPFYAQLKGKKKRITLAIYSIILLSVIAFSGLYTKQVYQDYTSIVETSYPSDTLLAKNYNGEYYFHKLDDPRTVNGAYITRYMYLPELWEEWPKRSDLDIKGKDLAGQNLQATLLSFLTSKGLTKDSLGFSKLSDKEIKAIENGISNVYYLHHNRLENRLHKTLYEIDTYLESDYANGASLAMRIEYWKTAWHIIKKQPILGVGTGDIKAAFKTQYEIDQSTLEEKYRRRTHNQYISIWVALGVIGLLVFITSLAVPAIMVDSQNRRLFFAFFILSCLSFITEDTLETQAGVTFFALFNSLLLFGRRSQDIISK